MGLKVNTRSNLISRYLWSDASCEVYQEVTILFYSYRYNRIVLI